MRWLLADARRRGSAVKLAQFETQLMEVAHDQDVRSMAGLQSKVPADEQFSTIPSLIKDGVIRRASSGVDALGIPAFSAR
jgi:hypothetical protein